MQVVGSLVVPVVAAIPDNAQGETGEMVMVIGTGPFYHNGATWTPYQEGSRVFIGTRPANPQPYDIFIPES